MFEETFRDWKVRAGTDGFCKICLARNMFGPQKADKYE